MAEIWFWASWIIVVILCSSFGNAISYYINANADYWREEARYLRKEVDDDSANDIH